jgi:hypothetical protein
MKEESINQLNIKRQKLHIGGCVLFVKNYLKNNYMLKINVQ